VGITKAAEYLNPDPIERLIGPMNLANLYLDGHEVTCLLDTGCQIANITQALCSQLQLPIRPLNDLIDLSATGGTKVEYLGYTEVHLEVPAPISWEGDVLFLVIPQDDIACTISTKILDLVFNATPFEQLRSSDVWKHALQSKETSNVLHYVRCEQLQPVAGNVCLTKKVTIPAHSTVNLKGTVKLPPQSKRIHVITDEAPDFPLPEGLKVHPKYSDLLPGHTRLDCIISNTTPAPIHLTRKMKIAQMEPANCIPKATLKVDEVPDEETMDSPSTPIPEEGWQQVLDKIGLGNLDSYTPEQQAAAYQVLFDHASVFSHHSLDLGCTHLINHDIKLDNPTPFKERYRRIPPHLYDEVKKNLNEMLELGAITPSQSPWCSPVVLVRKKDGSLRFCIDFRKLNDRTIKDAYSLPRIEETFDSLTGARVFSILDLKSGYWQVAMDPDAQAKTAFTVGPLGFFECTRMPFGLTNAPATFQRLMESCLGDLHHKFCLIYIDDIIIYSPTFEDHLQHLGEVFRRLQAAGLKVKPSKCAFFQESLDYLGHVVTAEGISTSPKKIEVLQQWPTPATVHDVRSFLGFAGYYRRFIHHFSQIAKPLYALLEGDMVKYHPIEWTTDCDEAFRLLKDKCSSAPVLAYPDFQQPFILHTDASLTGLGAVLYQELDGKKRVIAYASRSLSKSELNYPVHKLEFLALKWAVLTKFHEYLYGQSFDVYTDNNPLTYVLTSAKLDAAGHRWVAALANYDFRIHYKAGSTHTDVDALSRIPWPDCLRQIDRDVVHAVCRSCTMSTPAYIESLAAAPRMLNPFNSDGLYHHLQQMTSEDWVQAQSSDPVLSRLRQLLQDGELQSYRAVASDSDVLRRYLRLRKQLILQDGVLYRILRTTDQMQPIQQLMLPSSYWDLALCFCHDDVGHHGRDRTLSLLRDRFFWDRMEHHTTLHIQRCLRCIKFKARQERADLVPYHVTRPMELIHIDFLKLDPSKGNVEDVLVITDHFTRYSQAFPTRSQTAQITAKCLWENFFSHYGFPDSILSDQGANFESDLIQHLCQYAGVRKLRTTPYHPQTNGQCERFNRTLINMIGTLPDEEKTDWKERIRHLTHAYNCTRNSATGFSPYFLLFGRVPRLPVDVQFGLAVPSVVTPSKSHYLHQLRKRMRWAFTQVQRQQDRQDARNRRAYDRAHAASHLDVGDDVLIRCTGHRKRHKLQDRWSHDTYTVLAQPDASVPVYRVGSPTQRSRTLHRNQLLPLRASSGDDDLLVGEDEVADEVAVDIPKDDAAEEDSISDVPEEPVQEADGTQMSHQDADDDVGKSLVLAMTRDDGDDGTLEQSAVSPALITDELCPFDDVDFGDTSFSDDSAVLSAAEEFERWYTDEENVSDMDDVTFDSQDLSMKPDDIDEDTTPDVFTDAQELDEDDRARSSGAAPPAVVQDDPQPVEKVDPAPPGVALQDLSSGDEEEDFHDVVEDLGKPPMAPRGRGRRRQPRPALPPRQRSARQRNPVNRLISDPRFTDSKATWMSSTSTGVKNVQRNVPR
jgi:hypothetical protein